MEGGGLDLYSTARFDSVFRQSLLTRPRNTVFPVLFTSNVAIRLVWVLVIGDKATATLQNYFLGVFITSFSFSLSFFFCVIGMDRVMKTANLTISF